MKTEDDELLSLELGDSPPLRGYATVNRRKAFLSKKFGFEEVGDPPPMIETPSGLKYRILEQGSGEQVTPDARLTLNYLANLESGKNYDALLTGGKKGDIPEKFFRPVTYLLRDMIPAWKEGLILLKEGGLIEMEIPPALGFQEAGDPRMSVPPNETLFHIVRVLGVNPKMFRDLAREVIDKENFNESEGKVFYKILKQTDGRRPSFADIVTINYTVSRIDGRKFIDTYENGGPVRVPLFRLVSGMSEGVKMIGEGGSIDLILSPEKGFGRHSQNDSVPNNTFVRVKMELLKVESNTKLGLPAGGQPSTDKENPNSSVEEGEDKKTEQELKSGDQTPAEPEKSQEPEKEPSATSGE